MSALTCAGSRVLGKMALTGLSLGDKQAFSLECLCFSAIWGEPGTDGMNCHTGNELGHKYTSAFTNT